MKNLMMVSLLALSVSSFAETMKHEMTDAGSKKLATILKGKTLVCVPSEKAGYKQEAKGFYPVKISAETKKNKTFVTIATAAKDVQFGFGGDELTDVEVSKSWAHLSVGDDGRREFMFQHYEGFADPGESECYVGRDGEYSGGIAGLNSTIWDAGTISSHGIQCCLE